MDYHGLSFGLFAGKGSENGPNFVQKSEFLIEYKNNSINHLPNRIFIISFSPKKKHINLSYLITYNIVELNAVGDYKF